MKRYFLLVSVAIGMLAAAVVLTGSEKESFPDLRLSDFPWTFKESTMIVIGSNAFEIEIQAANEITEYLENETGNKPLIKKYSEVTEEDRKNYNLIVIGSLKSNPMLREIVNEAKGRKIFKLEFEGLNTYWQGNNKGYLVILKNLWSKNRYIMLVGGNIFDNTGVFIASKTLLNSTLLKEINEPGILVRLENNRTNTYPISEVSKLVAKDIALGYFVKRCMGIPEGSINLKVSDFGDYWLIEDCVKILVNKYDGSVKEVKS